LTWLDCPIQLKLTSMATSSSQPSALPAAELACQLEVIGTPYNSIRRYQSETTRSFLRHHKVFPPSGQLEGSVRAHIFQATRSHSSQREVQPAERSASAAPPATHEVGRNSSDRNEVGRDAASPTLAGNELNAQPRVQSTAPLPPQPSREDGGETLDSSKLSNRLQEIERYEVDTSHML
jgi:hypothetical protein